MGETAQPFTNLVGADFHSIGPVVGKVVRNRVYKPGNDQTTKVQHKAVGYPHNGHVAGVSSRRAQEPHNLIGPGPSRQLNQVFGSGVDVDVAYWNRSSMATDCSMAILNSEIDSRADGIHRCIAF